MASAQTRSPGPAPADPVVPAAPADPVVPAAPVAGITGQRTKPDPKYRVYRPDFTPDELKAHVKWYVCNFYCE